MRPPATGALRAAAKSIAQPIRVVSTTHSNAVLSPREISFSRNATFAKVSTRYFSASSQAHAAPPGSSSSSSSAPTPPKGPIRDENILENSTHVRLVDPKSGALVGPFDTKTILSKLDRSKFFLQQVAPGQPSRATISYGPTSPPSAIDPSVLVQFPICKLINKKEEFDRKRALKRKSSSTPSTTATGSTASAAGTSKEVQLTWSVSPNDLSHKLSKAKKEMIKGARINLVVTTKSGSKKYNKGFNPKEDAKREELLQQIEDFLCSPNSEPDTEEGVAMEQKQPIARRLQDVDWQRGGSAAVMSFECYRK